MSDKEGKMKKKMLKSWSGEIAYIIEDDKKSNYQESLKDEKIDQAIKESTIKLDEDRLNSIRLLKAIKDSLTVHKALCENNEIPTQKLLIQDKIRASIGTENLKRFEPPIIKPGQSSKGTNFKKAPNYLKLWNEKHKFDTLKSKDEKFLRTVGKVSNKQTLCESDTRANQIKSGRKISYYVQDNFKRGRINQLENMRDKYGFQRKPGISPSKSPPRRKIPPTKQNALVNANFKRELIEFKSGTSDFLKNTSVNTAKNIEIKIEQKSGRKITNFLDGSVTDFRSDCPGDFIGMLPFLEPKSFSFHSKKANQGVNVNFQDFKPMETIRETDRELTPNESHVMNSEQNNIRKTLINGHDFTQEGSNLSFKPKKKQHSSKFSYRQGYTPFNQRDEYVYLSRPARSARFANTPACTVGKECKCHEQTLPMSAQSVDMTPFLVQLLESCLKVPETLKNIRNVNNTFVNDLQQWKSFSYNLIGQSKSPDRKLNISKSPSGGRSIGDDGGCQTCGDCHQILSKIMGILNEKQNRPCMDTNYPGGIMCKKCGCGKSHEKLQIPGFSSCECGEQYTSKARKPPIQRTQSISQKPPTARLSYENEIMSYYAKCSVPHQKLMNSSNMEKKTLHQPRCAAVDFDSDSDDSPCSHCSSCSSCSNC